MKSVPLIIESRLTIVLFVFAVLVFFNIHNIISITFTLSLHQHCWLHLPSKAHWRPANSCAFVGYVLSWNWTVAVTPAVRTPTRLIVGPSEALSMSRAWMTVLTNDVIFWKLDNWTVMDESKTNITSAPWAQAAIKPCISFVKSLKYLL